MKVCTQCGVEKELSEFYKDKTRKDGLRRWCKDCCKVYNRSETGRKANRIYHRNNLNHEREKAHHKVDYALRIGKLVRPEHCESCKKKRFAEAHHEDYSKPLTVRWLCTECHSEVC